MDMVMDGENWKKNEYVAGIAKMGMGIGRIRPIPV